MGVDLEHMAILLLRRLNTMQEIKRLTAELQDALSRNDKVSLSLILEMRADEMVKAEKCQEEIWLTAEGGPEEAGEVRRLMSQNFLEADPPQEPKEWKIHELRRKTAVLLKEIQEADQYINQRIGGRRSYYSTSRP